MSQLQDSWIAGQQGTLQDCPRYDIQVTGCSRSFFCVKDGTQACLKAYPKQDGINIATTSKRLKQIGHSIKQGVRSVKLAGVQT